MCVKLYQEKNKEESADCYCCGHAFYVGERIIIDDSARSFCNCQCAYAYHGNPITINENRGSILCAK